MNSCNFTFRTRFAAAIAAALCSAAAGAAVVPFAEGFSTDSANWRDATGAATLGWSPAGGFDGSAIASGGFNFLNSAANATPILFRAQDEFSSSNHAFEGNWLSEGVTEFSAYVKHNAPAPLTFFTRFSSAGNFPGAVGLNFAPVLPNTWTRIAFAIAPGNPQFINFETSDFATIFGSIGHVQIGVSVPAGLAGVDAPFTFSLDRPTIVPEPATVLSLAAGLLLLARRGLWREVR